ncbi:hypothetical protein [Vibrio owensii]|uniref:hypothetical protein n=2 Tax=Vibrio owensii TaxID=696485 RepID=UPI0012D3ABAB|nr:hypothetical protein [Vibrio owensii]
MLFTIILQPVSAADSVTVTYSINFVRPTCNMSISNPIYDFGKLTKGDGVIQHENFEVITECLNEGFDTYITASTTDTTNLERSTIRLTNADNEHAVMFLRAKESESNVVFDGSSEICAQRHEDIGTSRSCEISVFTNIDAEATTGRFSKQVVFTINYK